MLLPRRSLLEVLSTNTQSRKGLMRQDKEIKQKWKG